MRHLRHQLQRRIAARAEEASEARVATPDREGDAPALAPLEDASPASPPPAPAHPAPPAVTDAAAAALRRAQEQAPGLADGLRQLDPFQRHAACGATSLVVAAAVGSGKTTVLLHRLLWLHVIEGVPLRRIAVLTFTRRAASDISIRLAAMGLRPGHDELWLAGTFHAVAASLLRRALPVETLGVDPDFRILDANERASVWHAIIARDRLDIAHIDRLPARLAALAEGRVRWAAMRRDDDIVQLAEAYEAEKLRLRALDYDDLLRGASALLPHLPTAQAPLHVLVDELQDCDHDQLDLIDRLAAGARAAVFAVGDPHQAIYGWRGVASAGTFAAAAARWRAPVVALPHNYRAQATLVAAARGLLLGARIAVDAGASDLIATRPAGAPIAVVRVHDAAAESAWIASEIAAKVAAGADPGRLAVLGRTHLATEAVVAALARRGVPLRREAALAATVREVGGWLHALLVAGCQREVWALQVALAGGVRGLWDRTGARRWRQRRAQQAASDEDFDQALAALTAAAGARRGGDPALAARVRAGLGGLGDVLAATTGAEPAAALAAMERSLAIADLLRPPRPEADTEAVIAHQLLRAWHRSAEASGGGVAAWRQTLEAARRSGDWCWSEAHPDGTAQGLDGVAVWTIHAAKGLEFDDVWLVAANDGVLPLAGTMASPAAWQEEQRLLFVAMTRARERLVISWQAAPALPRAVGQPSPLLRLLPAATVTWYDAPPGAAAVAAQPSPVIAAATPPDALALDAARPAAPATRASPEAYAVGDAVAHARLGPGEVLACDEREVRVRFERHGERRLALALAGLVRLAKDAGAERQPAIR